jgi:hypothetical protein
LTPARTLHITNGDSAANTMNEARIIGDILPWRDVLHDGPLPPNLSLREMSRVRAKFLTELGWAGDRDLGREFFARDSVVEQYADYDGVVLWFEWDLYDQLQLLQLLDFFAGKLGTREQPLKLEHVSFDGYLGMLPVEKFQELNGEIFKYATEQEERVYCGDSSAAVYLQRLANGPSPLVSVQSDETNATFRLTEHGRAVLGRKRDWIELGGSDRWLGGVHLNGSNAEWRWDPEAQTPVTKKA